MRKSYKSDLFISFFSAQNSAAEETEEVLHAWQNLWQPSSLIFSISATITVRKGVCRRINRKVEQLMAVIKREEVDSLHNLSLLPRITRTLCP
jgi:hypothetical protein